MNPRRLATLIAEVSLAEDRPLVDELRKVPAAFGSAAASAAAAGDLSRALSLAGFDRDLAAVGAVWPRAVRQASSFLDRLPSTARLYLPLFQTAAYFLFIAFIQMMCLLILSRKVLPVMGVIARDHRLDVPHFWEATLALFIIGTIALIGFAALGASGWRRLPGWGRHLGRARDASLIAALVQTHAPSEVVNSWVRKATTLGDLSEGALSEDLLTIAADSGARAERAMLRFVTTVRIVGFGLLTLLAFGVTLSTYVFIARLAFIE